MHTIVDQKYLLSERICVSISLGEFELLHKFSNPGRSGRLIWLACDSLMHNGKVFVLIFCPSEKPPILFENFWRSLILERGGGKSCSKTARSSVSNVGTRNLSNPGCDARNPGGGTKVAQLSFQFWSKEKLTWYSFSHHCWGKIRIVWS